MLEALGEAGGLCTARTADVIVCTLDAGHYDVDDKPPFPAVGAPRTARFPLGLTLLGLEA
ncbi:hypothetical protein [Streptomyces sp. NPDC050422]|uniref:hypothetical protein n=1 Tax=Streptomyces sp. NPDC050422 TaxID=3365614 RepID=UPI0037A9871F